jgi:hypothetical protein
MEVIKREIIYSNSRNRPFEITIGLAAEISRLHIELAKTEENLAKAEIKRNLFLLMKREFMMLEWLKEKMKRIVN